MAARSFVTICLMSLSVIAAVPILPTPAIASDTSLNATVLVTDAGWAHCGRNPALRLSLRVEIKNASPEPLVLGRVSVAQERLYREGEKGELKLVGTSATPDEFTSNLTNPFEDIEEVVLPSNTSKIFTIIHYAYVSASHIQRDGDLRRIIASFHVTNVRQDGQVSGYWSFPTAIALPQRCELY